MGIIGVHLALIGFDELLCEHVFFGFCQECGQCKCDKRRLSGMVKKIAVYGTYKAKTPITYKQRYWKRTKIGTKQRYWKKVTRVQKTTKSGRYEFDGKGKDLLKAVRKAIYVMPKGFVSVSAEKFAESPELYGFEGEWIERTIESK